MASHIPETKPNTGVDLPLVKIAERFWVQNLVDWICSIVSWLTVKRIFDFMVAAILLILITPLLFVLMIIIKADSAGPAIFSQKRLGRYGREFNCYKLRSMYVDSQDVLDKQLEENSNQQEELRCYGKLKGCDPRVTDCGSWMRRWSLDELPQIINVLKGDMSLVGPRPYLCEERSQMGEYADCILSVLPGITGLWQVSGRNEIDFNSRLQIEKHYVLNRSLGMELRIIFKTIPVVLGQKGAY